MTRLLLASLTCTLGLLTTASFAEPDRTPPNVDAEEPFNAGPWNDAEIVFVGTLREVTPGPVARSLPPIYSHKLQISIERVLRGDMKVDTTIELSHSARQNQPPTFPTGQVCLVAASHTRGRLMANVVELSSSSKIAKVVAATSLPLGWQVDDERMISPWARLGEDIWSANATAKSEFTCAVTGRPALMVGSGITFAVEKVPPKVDVKWSNPDGDGEYRITLTNTTNKAVEIPALLSSGDKVLWGASVVILCQDAAYPIPGMTPITGDVKPTTLGPGESLSHVVNALSLSGPEWPKGGYRIEFRICLGERSQTMSFYYRSKHHDAIRDASQK